MNQNTYNMFQNFLETLIVQLPEDEPEAKRIKEAAILLSDALRSDETILR